MLNQKIEDPLLKTTKRTLQALPAPNNITLFWNLGSILGICLASQLIRGLIIARAYTASISERYTSIAVNMSSIENSWLIRYIHSNGASLFFICLFIHTGRGMILGSFNKVHLWNIGVSIFLLTIATAFIGYVLPANQISYWGASVITNLFSEVPYIGQDLIKLIWGGPSVRGPTLHRFYMVHFLLPFLLIALVIRHIVYLHTNGSSNPLGLKPRRVLFEPSFSTKDGAGVAAVLCLWLILSLTKPLIMGDDDNFTAANPSVTPHHIQPEWYFLFAYAILRRIPNKIGGIVALALSVLILYSLPLTRKRGYSKIMYTALKINFICLTQIIILLSWIGACPVESPYIETGQILTGLYFLCFIFNPVITLLLDKNKI